MTQLERLAQMLVGKTIQAAIVQPNGGTIKIKFTDGTQVEVGVPALPSP